MTLVKICGITNVEDALAALDAGADILGFVFAASARQVSPQRAREIIGALPQGTDTVGVFADETLDRIERGNGRAPESDGGGGRASACPPVRREKD